jgi:hypothetical protein
MTDRNPRPGDADEPTARQPIVPDSPHPDRPEATPPTTELPATDPPPAAAATPPTAAAAPPYAAAAPAAGQPAAEYPTAGAAVHGSPPRRRAWRSRRVPLLAAVAAVLVACLCGGGLVAVAGAAFVHVGDRDRVSDRIERAPRFDRGPVPGERWSDQWEDRDRPGGPMQRRERPAPVNPAEPTAPVPAPATPSAAAPVPSATA